MSGGLGPAVLAGDGAQEKGWLTPALVNPTWSSDFNRNQSNTRRFEVPH